MKSKLFLVVVISSFISGCASTASKNIANIDSNTGGEVARSVGDSQKNIRRYSMAVNGLPQYIFFKITKDGVWVEKKTSSFDKIQFTRWRGEDLTKDCLAVINYKFSYCDVSFQSSMRPQSIYMKKEFSASNAIVGAIAWPITLMALASGRDVVTKGKLDADSLQKIGSYVLDGLIKDIDVKYAKIKDQVSSVNVAPQQLLEFTNEYPGHPQLSELYISIMQAATAQNSMDGNISRLWIEQIASGKHGVKRTELMENLLGESVDKNDFRVAKIYRSALKGAGFRINSNVELKYKNLAIASGQFDDLYEFATSGDMAALKAAWVKASTLDEKKKAEHALVKMIAPKFLDISTRIRASGGTTVDGSSGGVVASLFGSKISSSAKVDIEYKVKKDDSIIKITQSYFADIGLKFIATGTLKWEKNCGFLWLSTCTGQDENYEEVYRKSAVFIIDPSASWEGKGVISIDWQPVRAGSGVHGGYVMGGAQGFNANSVRVVVDYVKILSPK